MEKLNIKKKELLVIGIIAFCVCAIWLFTTIVTKAYERKSETGYKLDTSRVLTIKSKNTNVMDPITNTTAAISQAALYSFPSADALMEASREVHYRITKLEPDNGYIDVLPTVPSSYKKTSKEIYISNQQTASTYGDIELIFNGPYNIENDIVNDQGVAGSRTSDGVMVNHDGSTMSYGYLSIDGGNTYEAYKGTASQKASLAAFVENDSADGFYMIELIDTPTNNWKTIVGIPLFNDSTAYAHEPHGFLYSGGNLGDWLGLTNENYNLTKYQSAPNRVNYLPIIYAKVKEKQNTAFNSYQNLISFGYDGIYRAFGINANLFSQTALSLNGLISTGAFNIDSVSVPEKIATLKYKNLMGSSGQFGHFSQNTLTTTVNINKLSDYDPNQYLDLGMGIKDGFEIESNNISTIGNGDATTAKITGDISNGMDKKYSIVDVRPIVLIRNHLYSTRSAFLYLKDPSIIPPYDGSGYSGKYNGLTYAGIENTTVTFSQSALPAFYSAYDTANPSKLYGKTTNGNLTNPFYADKDHFYLKTKIGNLSRDTGDGKTIRGVITDYILSNSTYTSGAGCYYPFPSYNGLGIVNSEGYTNAAQIYDENSVLSVEFGFTATVLISGSAFKIGNDTTNGFTPFTIGTTNDDLVNFNKNFDKATFEANDGLTEIVKNMNTEAFFTTTNYNAMKVNEKNEPLNDAKFALLAKSTVTPYRETRGQTNNYNNDDMFLLENKTVSNDIYSKTFTYDDFRDNIYKTTAAMGFFTSGATYTKGAIIIENIDPDLADSYYVFEILAPEGYKTIKPPGKNFLNQNVDLNDVKQNPYNSGFVWAPRFITQYFKFTQMSIIKGEVLTGGNGVDHIYDYMPKFINVPDIGLPNTGGIALGIILFVGLVSIIGGIYLRRRGKIRALKKITSMA